MFDLALAIEALVPQAKYGGSTTRNNLSQYRNLKWEDERSKPSWEDLQAVVVTEEEDPVI